MVEAEFRDEGAKRKLAAVRTTVRFLANAHRDVAGYIQEKLVDEVVAGQYVGVISGHFRRSWELVEAGPFSTALASELAVAPYAPFVVAWSQRKYGRNVLDITLQTYGQEAQRLLAAEFEYLVDKVNQGKQYRYRNPFN